MSGRSGGAETARKKEEVLKKEEKTATEMDIYKLFTRERGVPLSQKVIQYIQKVLSPETMEVYADIIRANYTGGILTEKEIDAAVKNRVKERQKIEVHPVQYRPEGVERYRVLKERVLAQKTSIVALKEGVKCMIFGMARVLDDGTLEIEDEDESVRVARIEKGEFFISRGVCAGFEGRLEKDGFVVEDIHLPSKNHSQSQTHRTNFIVVSQFVASQENIGKVGNILKVYTDYEIEISAVVLMMSDAESTANVQSKLESTLLKDYKSIDFIVIPGIGKRYFYPHGECRSHKNLKIATNPAEIVIDKSVFLAGLFDLVDGIKEESVIQGSFRQELGRVFLTQASFNPFITYTDLSYTGPITGVIIGDRYDCFTHKEDDQVFTICGDFQKSEGQFLFYNGSENNFEICSASGMAAE
ncbi:hypothetical protein NEMIN01_1447 [Nematocida minor]|uniref:uncharacterized protein n=1 Tax=Nematocida minor TaxID=1912983 RepID=UPI0022206474|nr:uncharacterized protein NEMIN01_1447 [Nematocida minor]KAI5191239.1 hypothetical protein NEMIN01_1447 [Nematocida minor]